MALIQDQDGTAAKVDSISKSQRTTSYNSLGVETENGYGNFGTFGNLGFALNSEFVFNNTEGYDSIGFNLTVPTGATVIFEGTFDDVLWSTVTLRRVSNDGYVKETNVSDRFIGSISCMRKIKARVSSAGTVAGSIIGRASKNVSTLEGIENGAPNDFELNLAEGKIAYHFLVNKFGLNTDVDTTTSPEDVWENGGAYTGFPLSLEGETITVVSSSINDTSAGSGARTLRITGLDRDYNIQTEDFTLNGTTNVVGSKIFKRVHTAMVLTSGGTNNANNNAGIISVFHTTTTANIFLAMRVGSNQTNTSAYTIPAGYTGYIRRIHVAVNAASLTTASVDYAIWTQSSLKTNSPRLRRPNTAFFGSINSDNIYGGLVFSEKTDIIIRCTSVSQNNTGIGAGYDIMLVKN